MLIACLLAEIDQNFSQAHRIVTTSILPLVEQYTDHSRDVWDGAKVAQSQGDKIGMYANHRPVLEAILRSQRQCLIVRI